MLDHQTVELTLIEVANQRGLTLDGKDLLEIRTRIATTLAAKERHHQRMKSPAYQWKKPAPRR
ncbi:hypothetical protein I2494_03985 [Budviciaceae bacterium BWR-B9]|uniref:Uncharacterized protein n=1 Tax=Limnobaculum allomyrinae TaxID=2791986 RepID=A0ABS1IMB2_9GAMM|nr:MULTISPECIES: hypothetical protein [Limnobaculum]MBK5142883.1 hypothetical protein [Limnobaculum allomyrinae]MBV7690230.1 hypothetical protein [Limnobaculum sp. M2-1]